MLVADGKGHGDRSKHAGEPLAQRHVPDGHGDHRLGPVREQGEGAWRNDDLQTGVLTDQLEGPGDGFFLDRQVGLERGKSSGDG